MKNCMINILNQNKPNSPWGEVHPDELFHKYR